MVWRKSLAASPWLPCSQSFVAAAICTLCRASSSAASGSGNLSSCFCTAERTRPMRSSRALPVKSWWQRLHLRATAAPLTKSLQRADHCVTRHSLQM